MAKIKIGLIFGGKSGEHEVSIKSAKEVMDNLDSKKYVVVPIAITKSGDWFIGDKGHSYMRRNLSKAHRAGGVGIERSSIAEKGAGLAKISGGADDLELDLIFPMGHGTYIEDGKLQGMLEMLGLPYLFSGTLASALAMNKQKTKLVAKHAGLKIAKEAIIMKDKKYDLKKIIQKLGLPIVVKPVEAGSSVGTSICKKKSELDKAINEAFKFGHEILLEQFVKGREFTVAVMGSQKPQALPVIEIIPKTSTFFSYEAKYKSGGSDEICPADIPDNIRKKLQNYAIKIFKALGCDDLARADFIWSEEDGQLYFLEINTIPGMTAASLAPKAAKAAGMTFGQFLDKLIALAIERHKKK
jgi:D-alanine-D-alanine ligase